MKGRTKSYIIRWKHEWDFFVKKNICIKSIKDTCLATNDQKMRRKKKKKRNLKHR